MSAPTLRDFARALLDADAHMIDRPMVAATMRRNEARERADNEARAALADATAKAWRGLVADAVIVDEATP